MDWLLNVHDLARRAGLVVPQLCTSRNGRLVENAWTCETFISGTPLQPGDLSSIAPHSSAFHALTAHLPQRPGFLSSQALLDADTGGDVDLGAMPPELAAACREA
jgi:hypothetical protein